MFPPYEKPAIAIAYLVRDLNRPLGNSSACQLNAGRTRPQRHINPGLGLNPSANLARIVRFQTPMPHKQPNYK
jgi:hypothetical protein